MDRHGDHAQDQHLTTPQRVDAMLAHLDTQRTRLTAVKTFYAQLTTQQQAAFDDLAPMMMHHGEGDRHGGGDHGGGDHDGAHHHHDGDQPMGPGGPPQG